MDIKIYRIQYEICGQRFYAVHIDSEIYVGFNVFNQLFHREWFIQKQIKNIKEYTKSKVNIIDYDYLLLDDCYNLLKHYLEPTGLYTKLSNYSVYKRLK